MSDEPDNLVLRALAAIRQQLDRVETKQDEIIVRLGSLGRDVADLRRDNIARLERRLDLLPADEG